jgi:hypothetical protein
LQHFPQITTTVIYSDISSILLEKKKKELFSGVFVTGFNIYFWRAQGDPPFMFNQMYAFGAGAFLLWLLQLADFVPKRHRKTNRKSSAKKT